MLKMAGRNALVVGGGPVAARRSAALAEAGAAVRVVAMDVSDAAREVEARHERVVVEARGFEASDCDGAFVVVVATDDAALNERVAATARDRGALVNRADAPEAGDFVVPAHRRRGPVTVAVSTGGASAAAGRRLVERCVEAIGEDWVTLLELARAVRPEAQRRISDPAARQAALRQFTDETALSTLREGGETALRAHLEWIIARAE